MLETRVIFTLILIAICGALPAAYSAESHCVSKELGAILESDRGKAPSVVSRNRKIDRDLSPSEIEARAEGNRAKVLKSARFRAQAIVLDHTTKNPAALAKLPEGTYVFIVDREGNLGIVNRVMDPGPGVSLYDSKSQFVGSHSGLSAYFRSIFKRPTEVVSAGEVVVRNGRVMAVTNASGTFRGGRANLDFAVEKFRSLGLRIDQRTAIVDYSKSAINPHVGVAQIVRAEIRAKRDAAFGRLVERTRKVMSRLDRLVTTPDEMTPLLMDSAIPEEERQLRWSAVHLMSSWMSFQEGSAERVEQTLSQIGERKYRKMLGFLETLDSP